MPIAWIGMRLLSPTPTITFILPSGFRGSFVIVSSVTGAPLPMAQSTKDYKFYIPKNGFLAIQTDKGFGKWHHTVATMPGGPTVRIAPLSAGERELPGLVLTSYGAGCGGLFREHWYSVEELNGEFNESKFKQICRLTEDLTKELKKRRGK